MTVLTALEDFNLTVAGLLNDLSFLRRPRPSVLGYKRAARAAFHFERDLRDELQRGTLRDVHGIGPATERIVRELSETGESATVARAIEQQTPSEKVRAELSSRRALRTGFLSRARAIRVLADAAPAGTVSRADYRGDFQLHSDWSDGSLSIAEMANGCLALGQSRICVTDLDRALAGIALAAGCIFAIDSDAHSIVELKDVEFGLAAARLAGIPADLVINCWDDERLDEWRLRLSRV